MNEVSLSDDLNVITAEINSYKQVAGQSIFEIGKRLKHVKENDLVHGEWINWLKSIDFTPRHAQRFIKVTEEIGENTTSVSHLGIAVMYEIATLPEEERTKQHEIPSTGEIKTVDEMTKRELQEVKRKLKQAQQQAEQAQKSEEIALRKLEEIESKGPEVIEKEVIKEVIPEHIKKQMFDREKELIKTTEKLDELQGKIELLKKQQSYASDEEKKDKELKALQYEANKTVLTTKLKMDEFLKDVAITAFRRGAIATSSQGTKDNLRQGLNELKYFIKEMELALDGRIEA